MEASIRKLRQLHQAVIHHDKYLDRFDALSLASVDLLLRNESLVEMKSLQKLGKEISDILNEGYIAQQSYLASMRRDLDICNENLRRINRHNVHGVIDESDAGDPESTVAEDELASRKMMLNNSQALEATLLANDIQNQLKQLYESIVESMDSKVFMLRLIREVLEFYHDSMVDIATRGGVLQADTKASLTITPRFEPILRHKIFVVAEDEDICQRIKALWANIVLGCPDNLALAERDLSRIIYRQKRSTIHWSFHAKLGCIFILLFWSISECFHNEKSGNHYIWQDPTFAVFMCFGDLLLLLLMWGVSMHVWKNAGIDYMRLLDLHHTELASVRLPVHHVLKSFANAALVFLVTFIIFNKAVRGAGLGYLNLATAHAIPVLLTIYYCYRIMQPFETRKHWLYMLWKVIAAPLYPVDFCAGYIGDLLTSLVRVSTPFLFALVYVAISIFAWATNHLDWAVSTSDKWWTENRFFTLVMIPFLTLYPLWIRLLQCLRRSVETGNRWPHMGNALKYTSAIIVISHGTYQPHLRQNSYWIASFVSATVFQFLWDVFQDWGMLVISLPPLIDKRRSNKNSNHSHNSSSKSNFLDGLGDMRIRIRSKRLLGPAWVYFAVMVTNLALRFAWTLTLLPTEEEEASEHSVYRSFLRHVGPFVAAAEIIRRMVWGFFRLEYEQITLIQKVQAEDMTEEMLLSQDIPFNKMGVGEVEMATTDDDNLAREEEGIRSTRLPLLSDSDTSSTDDPWDWSQLLPRDWLDTLYNCTSSTCVTTWDSRLRLVEAVVFAGAVLITIGMAAYPAYVALI